MSGNRPSAVNLQGWRDDSERLSKVLSRTICSVSRPMLVAVLKDWVTETKTAPAASSRSTSFAKSERERVSRST